MLIALSNLTDRQELQDAPTISNMVAAAESEEAAQLCEIVSATLPNARYLQASRLIAPPTRMALIQPSRMAWSDLLNGYVGSSCFKIGKNFVAPLKSTQDSPATVSRTAPDSFHNSGYLTVFRASYAAGGGVYDTHRVLLDLRELSEACGSSYAGGRANPWSRCTIGRLVTGAMIRQYSQKVAH